MKLIIVILFTVFAMPAFTQKVDTVEFRYIKYSFSKTEETRKYNRKFIIYKLGYNTVVFDGKNSLLKSVLEEVSQEEYDAFTERTTKFNTCKSCWQKYYNKAGILISEGLYNTDCPIGETRTYNGKTGKIKTVERWRSLSESEKTNHKNKCCFREGEFIYYRQDGSKEKIERYKDDVLVETIKF